MTEIEERIFGGDCRGGKYSVVKMKEHLPFSREFNIALLLTVLSNFDREAALKDSVF